MLGRAVSNEKQGWAIFAAMGVLFLAGVAALYPAEGSFAKKLSACPSSRASSSPRRA